MKIITDERPPVEPKSAIHLKSVHLFVDNIFIEDQLGNKYQIIVDLDGLPKVFVL